jgi:hypothetical protein
VDAIVIETLQRQYWNSFNESEQHKKMDNFHLYRDRTEVPEDFFMLRVRGRGGFGLVTREEPRVIVASVFLLHIFAQSNQ